VKLDLDTLPIVPTVQTERSMLPLRPVETVGWIAPLSWLPCWQRLSRRSLR
jgi:hypothetical protein